MTDRPTPEETPTERLLREALGARASLVTAQNLRQDTPPSRRLRRLRPVLTVTVPLLGLAAAVAVGVLRIDGDRIAERDDTPTAPAGGQQPTAVLERKDGSTWTALPLSTGTGGGHGPSAPFALAPGQSRTLTYRLKLTGYQKASVQLVGQALLDGSGGSAPTVGDTAGQLALG